MMRHFLTFTAVLLCSYTAHAESCGLQSESSFGQLQQIRRTNMAVGSIDVENSFCKKPVPTATQMKAWLSQLPENEIKNSFDALVPSSRRAVSGCKTEICRAEKIFGPKLGLKLIYLQARFKLNASHLVNGNASAWTDEELEPVLLAAHDFPASLEKFGKPLTRFTRGKTRYSDIEAEHNVCIPSNADLEFFDCYFGEINQNRATAFHELSHVIGKQFEESPEWLALSQWKLDKNGQPTIPGKEDCFISLNAMTNSHEDFADAMMAYRYDPAGLMSACPAKYDFLKTRVFKGVEYTSATSCTQ